MNLRRIERRWSMASVVRVGAGLALMLAIGGCGSKDSGGRSSRFSATPAADAVSEETQASSPAPKAILESTPTPPPGPTRSEGGVAQQQIIYSGDMTLEVDDVDKVVSQVGRMTRTAGGWISASMVSGSGEARPETRLTLRIPASRFSSLHDSLAALGDLVYESIGSQDVGREFVDLQARLANLKREEDVVATLFRREGKIADVLQVERELSRIRGEIEQTQGQLRYLQDQVAFSTLAVRLTPKRPALERRVAGWNLGYHVLRAWHALVGMARLITYALIYGAIVIVPLALVAVLAFRGIQAVRRRRE